MSAAGSAPPRCGSCESYQGRDIDQAAVERAAAAGHTVPAGHCWLNPAPIVRHADDRCSQHSELQRQRRRELAELTANALVAHGLELPKGG